MNSSSKFSFYLSKTSSWPSFDELNELILWDKDHFPTPWKSDLWLGLAQEEDYFLVRSPQGFALFKFFKLEGLAHLLKIVIIPSGRQKGLGKELLKASLEQIQSYGITRFYLEVEEGNHQAQKLYTSLGFKPLNKIKNFYGNGRHAWAMGLENL